MSGAGGPGLERRPLGRTGFHASRVGAGDAADRTLGTDACIEVIERAVALGCNVLDTAPSYEDGLSEVIVGHVVRNHKRDSLFVIDKIERLRASIIPQLDSSIFRMRIDTIDLVVFHAVADVAELERLLRPGGAFDECDVARREGLLRFRGVSSHAPEVIERALAEGRSDALLFPLGPRADPRWIGIRERCRERGVGTVCFKALGAGKLLGPTSGYGKPLAGDAPAAARATRTRFDVERCVRYTLTRDPDVTLLGMSTVAEVEEAVAAALRFTPMTPDELAAAEADAALEVLGKGRIGWDPPASG